MTDLTLMTFASDPATVLPSLALLSHRVRVLPMDAASLVKMPENTILFLDARDDLATAKTLCRLIHASGLSTPIVLVLTEGGFTVVNSQWGIADVVVASASPAEVEGRLRLVSERGNSPVNAVSGSGESGVQNEDGMIHSGDLVVALFALQALPAICDACDCHDTCDLTVGYLTFVRAIAYSCDGRLVPCPGNRNKRDCHACIRNTPYCARRFRIRNAR